MDFQYQDVALVPLIVFVTYLFGWLGVPRKLLPLVVTALSLAVGFVYLAPGDPRNAILMGLTLALASVGAYSTGKNLLEHFSG